MSYFIHLHDATFHEEPWPGLRRLGPFDTRKQADDQAAVCREQGMSVEGIYSAPESEKLA